MNGDRKCEGVLVVDDDADLLEVTQSVLEDCGHRVLTAENGEQALSVLRESMPRPCVILLDLMMPVMDGWRFRDEQEHDVALAPIPVVVVSGALDMLSKAASLRAAEHITKPLSFDQLLEVVRRYDHVQPTQ